MLTSYIAQKDTLRPATRPSAQRGREDNNPIQLRAKRETIAGGGGIRLCLLMSFSSRGESTAYSHLLIATTQKEKEDFLDCEKRSTNNAALFALAQPPRDVNWVGLPKMRSP